MCQSFADANTASVRSEHVVVVEGRHTGELDLLQAGAAVGREAPQLPVAVENQPTAVGVQFGASMIISAVLNTSMGGFPVVEASRTCAI